MQVTAAVEAKALKVEEILEAKGIKWSMDLADIVREECDKGAMVKRPARDIARRVLARIGK